MRPGAVDLAVETIVFFATHVLTDVDARIFAHNARMLDGGRTTPGTSHARLWLLLFDKQHKGGIVQDEALSRQVAADACVWGEPDLFHAMPRLAKSITSGTHAGMAATPEPNHRRYFWFHASLVLWNRTFGRRYPHQRFWWRIEPDVIFSGSLAVLVGQLSAPAITTAGAAISRAHPAASAASRASHRPQLRDQALTADVLLPHVMSYTSAEGRK